MTLIISDKLILPTGNPMLKITSSKQDDFCSLDSPCEVLFRYILEKIRICSVRLSLFIYLES